MSFKTRLLIVFLLLVNGIWAQDFNPIMDDNPLKTAMPILTVAPDAGASGMGDLGVATEPSINDQAWNCAKYVFNEYPMGISLSYIPWMRNVGATNINLLYLTGFYRYNDRLAFASSIRYFSLGNLTFMDENAQPIRPSNPNEFAVDISLSLRLSEVFSLGAAFRYIRSDLTGGAFQSSSGMLPISPANGVAADVGFFYTHPVQRGGLISNLSAGLSITNIGTKMNYVKDEVNGKAYFLPTILRLGGAMDMNVAYNQTLALSLELSKFLVPTPPQYERDEHGIVYDENGKPKIVRGMDDDVSVPVGMIQSFYDSPNGFSGELKKIMVSIGATYSYANFLKVRTGFYYDPKNEQHRYVTAGFGIVYSNYRIDLSYLIPVVSGFQSPLANTVHITLGATIGQPGRY